MVTDPLILSTYNNLQLDNTQPVNVQARSTQDKETLKTNTNGFIENTNRAYVGDGQVDFMPLEDVTKMKEEASQYGVVLHVVNDPAQPDKKDEYIAVTAESVSQIKSTNPENVSINNGVNGKGAELIAEYGGYVIVAGVLKDVVVVGGKYLIKEGDKFIAATKEQIGRIKGNGVEGKDNVEKINYDNISTAKYGQVTTPRDLNEQILWKEVRSDPTSGTILTKLDRDDRFPKSEGGTVNNSVSIR